MTGAPGGALPVEDLRDVVAVDTREVEREDAAPLVTGGRPEEREPLDLAETVERVVAQLSFRRVHRAESQLVEPGDRGAESDGLGDRRGAALELGRQARPSDLLAADLLDHRAAADERLHPVEHLAAAEQDADAGRPVHLV